jgi:Bacterial Ig-like domain (group 3)/Domain of unknown function (DUF4214)
VIRGKRPVRTCIIVAAAIFVPCATLPWSSAASAQPVPIALTLDSSANPSPLYQDVTYTATVVTSDAGLLDPADTIEFQENGSDINGCSGQLLTPAAPIGTYTATCDGAGSAMSLGDHSITALFNGDVNYSPNTAFLTQMVSPGTTNTTITSPSSGSSVSFGNESNTSFNVTVSSSGSGNQSPSGNVDIYSGTPGPNTYLCSAYLNGSGNEQSNGNCYINNATLNAGLYSLTAVYGGDGTFDGSSSTPEAFTVSQVTSQMSVFIVPGYAFYGAENGNFLIVGVGGSNNGGPTGDATITANGVSLIAPGTCSVGNGGGSPCYLDSATALPASPTPYRVTTSYAGDANFTPVSTTSSLLVLSATTTSTLSVSPSSSASNNESSITISATVTSGTTGAPSGSVVVQNGGLTVCTITNLRPVGSNAATGGCSALGDADLPAGNYSLTANYQGDGNYQSSVSSAQSLTISNSVPTGTSSPPAPVQGCGSDTGDAAFVCVLYEDLLDRSPDAGGLATYAAQLSAGISRIVVANEILTSTEYHSDQISSYYKAYLGRPADTSGMATFLSLFNQGASDQAVQANILGSPEFLNHAGGGAIGYVNALYGDLLGRSADAGGVVTYTAQISAGISRSVVADEILTSTEYHSDLISSYYEMYLTRPADPGGMATFLALFNHGANDEVVQELILDSPEFYLRSQ